MFFFFLCFCFIISQEESNFVAKMFLVKKEDCCGEDKDFGSWNFAALLFTKIWFPKPRNFKILSRIQDVNSQNSRNTKLKMISSLNNPRFHDLIKTDFGWLQESQLKFQELQDCGFKQSGTSRNPSFDQDRFPGIFVRLASYFFFCM